MGYIITLSLILVIITIGVGIYGIKNEIKGKKATRLLGMNLSTFFVLLVATTIMLFSGSPVIASTATTTTTPTGTAVGANVDGLRFLAAALSTGLACIGAGIAVAISGSAAIGAISENEKLLGKTIIFVGLAEGIAIYGMIISIMILNQ
ncbi:MAG: ATP synthase subunit C [Vallitaleaceae bacterium]|jgi:V/A-type H+-transporting ATPase subunit K|nr:ATP synthase subunit C [Vallitaleaceae bacterium]